MKGIRVYDLGLRDWRREIELSRVKRLCLSTRTEIHAANHEQINCLELDSIDARYLLAGGVDGRVSIYDLEQCPKKEKEDEDEKGDDDGKVQVIDALVASSRSNPAHSEHIPVSRMYISSIDWYPYDTGAFITGSLDHSVKIWDTNEFCPIANFDLGSKVFCAKVHSTNSQSFVAAATEKHGIRLCDMNSGSSVHTLQGHREAVTQVAWSPSSEYLLASGDKVGSVKVWDIRKGGTSASLLSLDWQQDHTATANPDPFYRHINHRLDAIARAHEDAIMALVYSSCGNFLVSSGNDRRIRLWDAHSGNMHTTNYTGGRRSVFPYQMKTLSLPSSGSVGDIIALPRDQCDVALYSMHSTSGDPFHTLAGHFKHVNAIAYRDRLQQLCTGGKDGMIFLWEPHLQLQEGHTGDSRRGSGDVWLDSDSGADSDSSAEVVAVRPGGNRGRGRGRGSRVTESRRGRGFVPAIIARIMEEVDPTHPFSSSSSSVPLSTRPVPTVPPPSSPSSPSYAAPLSGSTGYYNRSSHMREYLTGPSNIEIQTEIQTEVRREYSWLGPLPSESKSEVLSAVSVVGQGQWQGQGQGQGQSSSVLNDRVIGSERQGRGRGRGRGRGESARALIMKKVDNALLRGGGGRGGGGGRC